MPPLYAEHRGTAVVHRMTSPDFVSPGAVVRQTVSEGFSGAELLGLCVLIRKFVFTLSFGGGLEILFFSTVDVIFPENYRTRNSLRIQIHINILFLLFLFRAAFPTDSSTTHRLHHRHPQLSSSSRLCPLPCSSPYRLYRRP